MKKKKKRKHVQHARKFEDQAKERQRPMYGGNAREGGKRERRTWDLKMRQ